VVDPFIEMVELRASIDKMWPMLAELGLNENADPSRVTHCGQIDDTLATVEFVQECSPEKLVHLICCR